MRLRALSLFLLLGSVSAFGQFSNDWIQPGQKYFKIPVSQDGIYRLTYANLQAVGFPLDKDPRYIRLFHRGIEQSIYVNGESDGTFDANDFLEFYGLKNDGTLDSSLYKTPSLQPHKYYNLYSDTTAYFLTNAYPNYLGMRMEVTSNANSSGLPAEPYQLSERLMVLHDQYSPGYRESDLIWATAFDLGEGWTGVPIQQGQSIDYTIDSLFNVVNTGPKLRLELLLVGRDTPTHNIQVLVGQNASSSLTLVSAPTFIGFDTYLVTADVDLNNIGADGKMLVRITGLPAGTNRYQVSASYIKATFPQSFDWGSQTKKGFKIEVKPGQSYLSITNPPSNLRLWNISDLQNITRVDPVVPNQSSFNVVVDGGTSKLFSSSVFITPKVIPVTFRNFNASASNFIIITNKILTKPGGNYTNPVKAYAAYRADPNHGGYDTLIATVDQLYNQFNYGETSPMAIYNFMKFITQHEIKYLFLIGKGRDVNSFSGYQRKTVPSNEFLDLVPSAGFPGGDNAFTSRLSPTYYPLVPTGRLTAAAPAQVAAYLEKVKDIESLGIQPWSKQLLHLSGGGSSADDADELQRFKAYVDGYKAIAEGPYLGGHVTTKSKSNVGIEKINVVPTVNSGVNLVTFFGHSSSSTIDIDIGYVSDPTLGYANTNGKYPAFLINGCNAGSIFSNTVTFSEDWMLAAGKGSRNFIAGTSFGIAGDLDTYSTVFYQVGFGDSTYITKGIGDIHKETNRQYMDIAKPNIYSIAMIDQMVLAGDPSLKLFGTNRPDYAIENGSLSLAAFDNKPVTSLSDSFAVKIILKNLGAYYPKQAKVQVIRTFGNDSTKSYFHTFPPTLYIDTLSFTLKKEPGIDGFGNNLFTVRIDPLDSIKELSKANNTAILKAFIPSNGTINLFPSNFGIVNPASINLVFQDANLLGAQRNFIVQLDTTNSFGSSFMKQQTVSAKVLAKASFNLLSGDSVVYFWRTKPVKQSASDSSEWTVSSFVRISGSPEGWAQTKFTQYNSDALINLTAESGQNKIDFIETTSHLTVKSIGLNSGGSASDASFKVDGLEYNVTPQQVGVGCRYNTINVVAFNKQTAAPYPGLSVYWNDARGCGYQPSVINSFTSSELQTGDGIDLLHCVDNIASSDSVVLYSVGNPSFTTWPSNVLTKLHDLGISDSQITSLTNGEPVVILAKKGAAIGSAKIFRTSASPATAQNLSVSSTITGRFISGKIKSPVIGPAKQWSKFYSQSRAVEVSDQVSYSIYGITLTGQETLIQSGIKDFLDLTSVNAAIYPKLRVQLNLSDSVNLTAAQLRQWFVFYESVAEGLLIYNGTQDVQTVQEGQSFSNEYGFMNISEKTFSDSLLVNVSTLTLQTSTISSSEFKIKAPVPGDTTKFSVSVNTRGKVGLNDLTVFVNPKVQPEMYYENNILTLSQHLNVTSDNSQPLLDVTVDNRYLQNGDFVSPNPSIRIKLHDENPFLFVTDTTHLNVSLSYPCSEDDCRFQRVSFSKSDVQWSPASAGVDFMALFHLSNLPEGTYTLQINGSDASGNQSSTPYNVSFKVKNETTLALRAVYPNPSKDVFHFNFELSGNVLPDDFSLQLYSSEGQLLQQFGTKDVSDFIIGDNDLLWHATQSEYGNGLIIYKLTVSANGKTASQTGRLLFIK